MSLDLSRLENVRERGRKIIARCPACAIDGQDEKGEHLVIMPDGRFGCVIWPGTGGKAHRQKIHAIAGDATSRSRATCSIRIRRAGDRRGPTQCGQDVDLGQLKTQGPAPQTSPARSAARAFDAPRFEPREFRPGELAEALDPDAAVAFIRRLVGDRLPSLVSRQETVQFALDACSLAWDREDGDFASRLLDMNAEVTALASLHAGMVLVGALTAGQDARNAGETAVDAFCEILCIKPPPAEVDPESGYPVVDGAVCPF